MRLLPVIARIQVECPIFVEVGPARSLNAVEDLDLDVPAAFVHPWEEASPPNETLQVVTQRRRTRFAVLTAARNLEGSTEQLEDAREQLIPALLGHQLTPAHEPIEHEKGEVVAVDGILIWWRDIFVTSVYMRST